MQVDAKGKAGRKHKKEKSSGRSHRHADDPADGSDGGRERRHSSPSKADRKHAKHAAEQSTSSSTPPAAAGGPSQTRSSTGGNQIVLSDPAAAFVLVATQEFVRVYSISHAVAADRTTLRKVVMQGTLQFASAFMACGSPALACLLEIDTEVHLQVRAAGICREARS